MSASLCSKPISADFDNEGIGRSDEQIV